jgi:hypothetical protein
MKHFTLVFLFLINIFYLKAQVDYPVSPVGNSIKPIDRQEFFDWDVNTNQWVRNYENRFEYNTNHDLITKIIYSDNSSSQTYLYNNNNALTSISNSTIDNGTTLPSSRIDYKYDSQCLTTPDSIIRYMYNSGQFQPVYFQDHSNNVNCQTSTFIGGTVSVPIANQTFHYYNSTGQRSHSYSFQANSTWGFDTTEAYFYTYNNGHLETEAQWGYNIFTVKYEYIRDANGHILMMYIYYPSNTINTPPNLGIPNWELSSRRHLHTYNSQGQKVMLERQSQNAAMQWETTSKITYQYDSDGDLEVKTEELKTANGFENYQKEEYHYVFNTNQKSIQKTNFSCFFKNPYIKGTRIECSDLMAARVYQVKLYDIIGRLVESQKVQNNSFELNNISEGFLYILTIEAEGKLIHYQKIIGQK